jgi:SAM-dependent methyltransferase
MCAMRSRFAGGDQAYLRDEQYRSSGRLAARASLPAKYSTADQPWFDWVSARFDLQPDLRVLEVGCGAGWLWEQSTVPVPSRDDLVLTDLSQGMVDEAVARVRATGRFESVNGDTADAQSLPFETGMFDRVIANHMLYHLPEPSQGVAELARVAAPGGRVVVATNGRRHMRELWDIRGEVFGVEPVDQTIDVFGVESGFPVLREFFDNVSWNSRRDELRCTEPDDVLAYVCSMPPGEDATATQRALLVDLIRRAFEIGGGTMSISKDTGCFICTEPRRPRR